MIRQSGNLIEKWTALYVRLSRDDENEGDSNSIAHQIEILTRYCQDRGISSYKVYKDDGWSGTNFRKPDNFRSIQDEITRLALEKRKTPVIIIDEANYVSNTILNDLKILFNFEMDSKDRAVILLVGLPQLNSTLRLGVHEPLRQRIIMNYNMEGLSKDEGRNYISEKLRGAGGNPDIFEENAVEAVLNAADGTPRMINKLCTASILVAASRELNSINADAVMQAVSDCELG